MKKIFVSNGNIESEIVQKFIGILREAGFVVHHSPRDESDLRFIKWYDRDLDKALDDSDIFIAIVDGAWEGSTWMAIEAENALKRFKSGLLKGYCYYYPQEMDYIGEGMKKYLINRLPLKSEDIVDELSKET